MSAYGKLTLPLMTVTAVQQTVVFLTPEDEKLVMAYSIWNRIGRPTEIEIIGRRHVIDHGTGTSDRPVGSIEREH